MRSESQIQESIEKASDAIKTNEEIQTIDQSDNLITYRKVNPNGIHAQIQVLIQMFSLFEQTYDFIEPCENLINSNELEIDTILKRIKEQILMICDLPSETLKLLEIHINNILTINKRELDKQVPL